MSYPLHAGEHHQYLWNPVREAVAEYVKGGPLLGNAWMFTGWLWDGQVHTAADARDRLAVFLKAFPSAGE